MINLHTSCRAHIEECTRDLSEVVERTLQLESDLGQWLDILGQRVEAAQLRSAHQDLGLALYSAMAGLYRQSFSSLRSFLEVSIATIYLSASEFRRRQWVSGKIDISWSAITSPDDGIYSAAYVSEFCTHALSDRSEMLTLLKSSYRRCSEYIHGNVAASNLLPRSITYERDLVLEWLQLSRDAIVAVIHCCFVRYYAELDSNQVGVVEGSLEESLMHLVSVRNALGLPVEGTEL